MSRARCIPDAGSFEGTSLNASGKKGVDVHAMGGAQHIHLQSTDGGMSMPKHDCDHATEAVWEGMKG